jgi:hypothetical protein
VDQHQPGVDQVERLRWWRVADHVVTAYFQDTACRGFGPRHVDVGGQHPAGGSHARGQAVRYRDTACADLPTPPAFAEPHVVEVAERPGVEQLGERREPLARFRAAVVEQVTVHGNSMTPSTSRGYGR